MRCLELNLYHHYSPDEASLGKKRRDTALFDFMLKVAKPLVLLVHGGKSIEHLEGLLSVSAIKGRFTPASYQGARLEVFAADRHFAYMSRHYVASVAANKISCI